MASFIESQAVLEARLKAVGFDDDIKDKFIAAGITCLSQLAFMSSYSPGANDESPLIDAFKVILAREPSIGEKANMRRVFNEAYASVTAEMRQNVERVEESTVRKLSQPERHDRYIKQAARLTGVSVRGPTEPGDGLVDAFCSMYDDNRLRFLESEWGKYVSKDQEMHSEGKKITSFALDQASGKLKIENKGPDEKADMSADILVLQALTRRSLAMDQANLVSYVKIQAWVDRLLKCRTEEAPPGYSNPSLRQIMLADQKLFIELADRTRSGVQATAAGKPIDDIIENVMYLNEVTCLLQPLPKMKEVASIREHVSEPYVQKGKGKGKGKKGGKSSRMPSDLVGCRSHTNSGSPICYGFNLKTCSEAVKDGRCSKGFHICAVPRCGKHHPAVDCPSFASVKKS